MKNVSTANIDPTQKTTAEVVAYHLELLKKKYNINNLNGKYKDLVEHLIFSQTVRDLAVRFLGCNETKWQGVIEQAMTMLEENDMRIIKERGFEKK